MPPTDAQHMLFRSSALSLLTRVQQGISHTELVHVPHPLWPLPSRDTSTWTRPLRISVLDASYNPPTLAHLALVNAPRPKVEFNSGDDAEDYDAKLLLLSVRNADKTLKPTDATYIQRLEMMHLLAQHVHPPSTTNPSPSVGAAANVAIGIINEPTFVGKSTRLLDFLRSHLKSISPSAETREGDNIHLELSFILGLDTLERLIAPRYYPSETDMLIALRRFLSPTEENSIVVCARRNQPTTSSSSTLREDNKLVLAQEFIESGRVVMIDIGDEESTYSSTAVRNAIKELGFGEEGRKIWGKYIMGSVADYIVGEGLYVG